MTNEDAIKYLKQLFPYGGHCWLDEQRTEAIGMAIQALQEEPVSEELEEVMQRNAPDNIGIDDLLYWRNGFITGTKWQKAKDESSTEDLGDYINELSKQFPEVSFAKLSRIAVRVAKWQKEKEYTCYEEAFEDGAKWKKEQMVKDAIDAEVLENYDGKVLEYDDSILDEKLSNCKVFDKVKMIVIKKDEL